MSPKTEALTLARALIESTGGGFICHALTDVAQSSPNLERACQAVIRRVEVDLHPFSTLGQWLAKTYGRLPCRGDLATARLAWIDKMLDDLSKRREALKLARRCLESQRFICHALVWVSHLRPGLGEICEDLKGEIDRGLAGETTLESFILNEHQDNCLNARSDLAQLARLAWIDKLLEES